MNHKLSAIKLFFIFKHPYFLLTQRYSMNSTDTHPTASDECKRCKPTNGTNKVLFIQYSAGELQLYVDM